jgi:hypothetical protein
MSIPRSICNLRSMPLLFFCYFVPPVNPGLICSTSLLHFGLVSSWVFSILPYIRFPSDICLHLEDI